jgi:hypothetical protein
MRYFLAEKNSTDVPVGGKNYYGLLRKRDFLTVYEKFGISYHPKKTAAFEDRRLDDFSFPPPTDKKRAFAFFVTESRSACRLC